MDASLNTVLLVIIAVILFIALVAGWNLEL